MEDGALILTADDGSEETFFVLEKAEIAGFNYLLVCDDPENEEAEVVILKEVQDGDMMTYDVLVDEKEQMIISKYFEELLEDVDIELE